VWLRKKLRIKLIFKDSKERKCSVLLIMIESNSYDNKLNSFVTSTLNYKNILNINNFNKKYTEKALTFALKE